jgi:DNA-directed RNA polymerase I subunit RPA2
MASKIPAFKNLLTSLGMHAQQSDYNLVYPVNFLPVLLDGILMGYVDPKLAPHMVSQLRYLKMKQNKTDELESTVPMTLEVAYLAPGRMSVADVPESENVKHYYFPGVFLSSQVSRFVRPVKNLVHGGTEWLGPLEQITLQIATLREDLRPDMTH